MSSNPLPKRLLERIAWSFIGAPFDRIEDLSEKVRESQIAIYGEDNWRPDEVVLSRPKVLVTYWGARGEEQVEPVVELSSANGEYFTAAELLFKLHNAVVADLADIDHHFLEGLLLNSHPVGSVPPLYVLHQGS